VGGKLPAHPSPKRQFLNLGIPACFLQGCLGWARGSPCLGPVFCWVSGLLKEPFLLRQWSLLSLGGQAYVRYGLCKHSTHTRIFFAMHPPFYASIVSKFQCLFRCHVWHVESSLALYLSSRSDQPLDRVIALAMLARQRRRAGLWTSYCVFNCVVPVSSISDDLFSGMCRGNGK